MTVCRCGLPSFGLSSCYRCLKRTVDWNQDPPRADDLNETERTFVGLFPPRASDGWEPADGWVRRVDPDRIDVDPERVAMLRALQDVGGMTEL